MTVVSTVLLPRLAIFYCIIMKDGHGTLSKMLQCCSHSNASFSFVVSACTALPVCVFISQINGWRTGVDVVHKTKDYKCCLPTRLDFTWLTAAMVDVSTTVDSKLCGLANANVCRRKFLWIIKYPRSICKNVLLQNFPTIRNVTKQGVRWSLCAVIAYETVW